MAKVILTVNATQVDAQGNFTTVSGFPKRFSSDSYAQAADPIKTAKRRAKAAYFAQLSANYSVDNIPMWTVTIENADGTQIMRETEGDFPENE